MSPLTRLVPTKQALTWSPVTESNRRPSPYHGDALPTELTGPHFLLVDLRFLALRRFFEVLDCGVTASNVTDMTTTGTPPSVGELTSLLMSWRLHLEAANLSPRTIRAYTDDGALFAMFLAKQGMPTAVGNIRREHVEA